MVNISELALCLCDRRVWSFQYVATQRLQVGAFIGDAILGRYFALGNTCPVHLSSSVCFDVQFEEDLDTDESDDLINVHEFPSYAFGRRDYAAGSFGFVAYLAA